MINVNDVSKAKKLIKDSKERPILVKAQDDVFNRKILEYGKFDILIGIEMGNKKNKLKQIDSGFNHVMANIAAKNKIALGIDIENILNMDKKEKAIVISRIVQNLKISRKKGIKIIAINYKDKKDIFSLMQSLGASSKQAKEAISF